MKRWMDGCTVCRDRWMDAGWMYCMQGWMDGWIDEGLDG